MIANTLHGLQMALECKDEWAVQALCKDYNIKEAQVSELVAAQPPSEAPNRAAIAAYNEASLTAPNQAAITAPDGVALASEASHTKKVPSQEKCFILDQYVRIAATNQCGRDLSTSLVLRVTCFCHIAFVYFHERGMHHGTLSTEKITHLYTIVNGPQWVRKYLGEKKCTQPLILLHLV
jgi:hypothetical protein